MICHIHIDVYINSSNDNIRPGADSGLELGCFMVPLVLLSQIVFGKQNAFILQGMCMQHYISIYVHLIM